MPIFKIITRDTLIVIISISIATDIATLASSTIFVVKIFLLLLDLMKINKTK